jgi:hypothetical protein
MTIDKNIASPRWYTRGAQPSEKEQLKRAHSSLNEALDAAKALVERVQRERRAQELSELWDEVLIGLNLKKRDSREPEPDEDRLRHHVLGDAAECADDEMLAYRILGQRPDPEPRPLYREMTDEEVVAQSKCTPWRPRRK